MTQNAMLHLLDADSGWFAVHSFESHIDKSGGALPIICLPSPGVETNLQVLSLRFHHGASTANTTDQHNFVIREGSYTEVKHEVQA